MFFAQPVAALTAIRRALRPGARFAASTVGPPDRNPMVGTVVAAILDALDLELPPLPAPGEPGFYSFSNGEVLEAAFVAAGFDEVDVEPFGIEYEYSSVVSSQIGCSPSAPRSTPCSASDPSAARKPGTPSRPPPSRTVLPTA
jgi:hypothetical protein